VTPAYHPEFKASFDAAYRHYQEIGLPLAERFKTEIKAGVRVVISGVVNHAPGPHGFRCYRCKKFPYLIYYERMEQAVTFLAVLYAGRAPGMLKETLERYRDEETPR
jgi:hypothetical protein